MPPIKCSKLQLNHFNGPLPLPPLNESTVLNEVQWGCTVSARLARWLVSAPLWPNSNLYLKKSIRHHPLWTFSVLANRWDLRIRDTILHSPAQLFQSYLGAPSMHLCNNGYVMGKKTYMLFPLWCLWTLSMCTVYIFRIIVSEEVNNKMAFFFLSLILHCKRMAPLNFEKTCFVFFQA